MLRSRMAAAIGLKGTKILRVKGTTLRIELSVPKGTQTGRNLRIRCAQKAAKRSGFSVSFVMAVVRVLYETEIIGL